MGTKPTGAKALEALAYAGLPEDVVIAKLAARKDLMAIFTLEDARIIIRSIAPDRGRLNPMAEALLNESVRQSRIRNDRKALKDARAKWAEPYTKTFRPPTKAELRYDEQINEWARAQGREGVRHAQLQFGDYIRSVFDEEILALMELTAEDCRTYRVEWGRCAARPAISATIKVVIEGSKGVFEQYFLLYKEPGTSKAHVVNLDRRPENVKDAWSQQVPPAALALKSLGYKFRTAFDTKEIVATGPEGDEQRFPWRGRVDE